MNNKIVVVGANQGALVFAEFAATTGFSVTLYEAKQKEEVAYDWTDDMNPATFADVGLPMPSKSMFERKRCWTFVPPKKGAQIYCDVPEKELDIGIERRQLNNWLEGRAIAAGATVLYGFAATKALTENNRVVGIALEDGTDVLADLVVDMGGANSAVRVSLPDSFHIPQKIKLDDAFFAIRTFFERKDGSSRPKYTDKAYLKHIGEKGISWCRLSHDEQCADVLIGRVGQLKAETYENALADLRAENEIIGEKSVKGGQPLCIPVRHPISRMVADGYVLLGDSAYMTIPMLGSGMASGMRAAKMLAEVISKPEGEAFSAANLYRYQYRFMQEIGAKHAAVNLMKNWLLSANPSDVDFLLTSGVVGQKEFKLGSIGEMITLTPLEMLDKVAKGYKKIPLLLNLNNLLMKMSRQFKLAKRLPQVYSDEELLRWQKKYAAVYGDEL